MARARKLVETKMTVVTVLSGRCSVCHRPFEVATGASEAPSKAKERLQEYFDAHSCRENISQAAARAVKEAS